MNEVFIIGKVVSKIDYRFIINKKNQFAKVEFTIKVDKQIIKVIGYNDIADFCFRNIKEDECIFINGKLRNKNYIIIYTIIVL